MNFDRFQKKWNEENVEIGRFKWLTRNKLINSMEMDLLSSLPIKQKYKVLEVGCGEGQNIFNLKKIYKNTDFSGVDMAKNRIEFAKTQLKDVNLKAQDGRDLGYSDNSFDIVFCRDVIHHMKKDRDKFIMQMLRVCKKGGKVILIESNGKSPMNFIFSLLVKKESELRNITPRYVTGLLNKLRINYSIKYKEKFNIQRLIFHFKYGFQKLGNMNFGRLLSNIINIIPIPKTYYAYMIIEIQK